MEFKTPLYETHLKYDAKIVNFGGFLMPIQYQTGIKAEHNNVRTACGLFDISHMGEVLCRGEHALESINNLLTNDFTSLKIGGARYGLMLNDKGGVIDDLIVFRTGEEEYLLIVNAGTQNTDFAWMQAHAGEAEYINQSSQYGAMSLQGPNSEAVIRKLVNEDDIPKGYYTLKTNVDVKGISCIISRTGYTGEIGFELFCPTERTAELWDLIMDAGQSQQILPIGLGARDTLRLEAGMPLYGNDITEEISPLEAGLDFGVKMNKPSFIGKEALEKMGTPSRKRVGLKVTGRGIVREHQDLYRGETPAGQTTSGTYCAWLSQSLAMGYVSTEFSQPGTVLEADVRGRRVEVEVVPLPFYKRK